MQPGPRRSPDSGGERRGSATFEILLALALLALAAWYGSCRLGTERRAVADDAYITYGYGRQIAAGRGMRFNADDAEPTAGCSTELHALFAAGAIAADVDPLGATRALSLVAVLGIGLMLGAAGARLARARASRGILGGAALAWVLMLLPETGVHLASGMETLLFALVHAALFLWAAWAGTRRAPPGPAPLAIAAPLFACALLARPEGALLVVLYVVAVVLARDTGAGLRAPLREAVPLLATTGILIAAYAAWRIHHYGSLLGNPFYVKSCNAIFGRRGDALPGLEAGASFLFLRAAPLSCIAWIASRVLPQPAGAARLTALCLLPSLAVLGAYAFVVHEMASGSRFEYPLLPPFLGVAAAALFSPALPAGRHALLAASTVAIPALAAPVNGDFVEFARHPRSSATAWIRRPGTDNALARAGRDLADAGLGPRATILLSAAGQIPWYSRFHAIDWIGLNDTRFSGRRALSIDEVWRILGAREPDVVQSILPPAARRASDPDAEHDENFGSPFVQATLDGRGSDLFAHWDRERLARMFRAEMDWVRERCEFGACYKLGNAWGDDWWVYLYVRKDSPHRERLLEVLRRSTRADRESDLGARFAFDPRRLGDGLDPSQK